MQKRTLNQTVGRNIRLIRKRQGLSQGELAQILSEMAGQRWTVWMVSEIEKAGSLPEERTSKRSAHERQIKVSELGAFMDVFGCTLFDLLLPPEEKSTWPLPPGEEPWGVAARLGDEEIVLSRAGVSARLFGLPPAATRGLAEMDRERRRLVGLGDVMLAHYHYEGAEHWSEVIHPIDLEKMRGSPWLAAGVDIEAFLDGEWEASLEVYRRVGREMELKEVNGRFVLPSEGEDNDGEH